MSHAKSTKHNQQKSASDGKIFGVYIKSLLVTNVLLSISEIGKNVKQNLEKKNCVKNGRQMYCRRIYPTKFSESTKLF